MRRSQCLQPIEREILWLGMELQFNTLYYLSHPSLLLAYRWTNSVCPGGGRRIIAIRPSSRTEMRDWDAELVDLLLKDKSGLTQLFSLIIAGNIVRVFLTKIVGILRRYGEISAVYVALSRLKSFRNPLLFSALSNFPPPPANSCFLIPMCVIPVVFFIQWQGVTCRVHTVKHNYITSIIVIMRVLTTTYFGPTCGLSSACKIRLDHLYYNVWKHSWE